MALEKITNPPVLDTTGQNIVSKLDQIKDAVQPINPCLDIDISIPANGWSSSSPYTYTYSNNHISSGCSVKVDFLEGAQSTKVLYLEFEKVVNGVRFTSATKPTTAIPVRLHILNADATSAMSTTADEVSTSAVSGSANVEDALGSLSEQIGNLMNSITNMYRQEIGIDSISGGYIKIGKAVFVDVMFTCTNPSGITADTAILNAPNSSISDQGLNLYGSNGELIKSKCRIYSGFIRMGIIPTANTTYHITGMYFAN